MRSKLLLFSYVFLALTCSCSTTQDSKSDLIYIPLTPPWKLQLYYGTDEGMPLNDSQLMSINYKPGTRTKRIDSLEALANAFNQYLPHWYLTAMVKNYKENNSCAVYVNGENYVDYVYLWMKEHLIHTDNQPHFLAYINAFGFEDVTRRYTYPGYESPAYTGACVFMATNDPKLAENEMINELREWRDFFKHQQAQP